MRRRSRKLTLLILKYHPGTLDSSYDAEILDEVLNNWRQKKGKKEKPEYVVLINELEEAESSGKVKERK